MNADTVARGIAASLARRADQIRRDMLEAGFKWPQPLVLPDAAAQGLASARAERERLAGELEAANKASSAAIVSAQEAKGVADRARVDLDDLRATRARQFADAAELGIAPGDMINLDAVEVRAAHVVRLQERADLLHAEAADTDRSRGQVVRELAQAGEDVAVAEALVAAARLIEPLTALRGALGALPNRAGYKHDRISMALGEAISSAIERQNHNLWRKRA